MNFLQRLPAILIAFVLPMAHAADPVISEFMADNVSSIADEDGDRSDWIEIHNPDPAPVSLDGWFLTDTASNKALWRFPAVTIPAKGYLLVFASDKNRRVVGQPLHTNFKLSAGGEYLALVKPDGVTVSSEFAPAFPAQVADVSYGQARAVQTLILTDKGSDARALVPPDNTLGTTWRSIGFSDASWPSGTLAVGYFTSGNALSGDIGLPVAMQNVNNTVYVRVPFSLPTGATLIKLTLRIKYDDGFAAFLNGQFAASSAGSPSPAALTFNSNSSVLHEASSFEDFDVTSSANALLSGGNVLALHGLNANLTSSDCFLLPQLIAELDTNQPGQIGYFATATPGQANGGNDSLRLPQVVGYSLPSGTFTTGFVLTLGGAASGQEIRYTISDPTAAGATLPEPSATSTLYTGQIAIGSSKLIRAAVFDPLTGQRGQSVTAQYLLLETSASGNTSNFTSNLPIIVADDHGDGSPVDSGTNTYTPTLLHVFPPVNGVASLNSTPVLFTRAGTRIRGSSSAGFCEKKAMGSSFGMNRTSISISRSSGWLRSRTGY